MDAGRASGEFGRGMRCGLMWRRAPVHHRVGVTGYGDSVDCGAGGAPLEYMLVLLGRSGCLDDTPLWTTALLT